MKFPESWTGGPLRRRGRCPDAAAQLASLACQVGPRRPRHHGRPRLGLEVPPCCMYRAVQTPQQPSVAPFADVDTDGDLVTLASWAWYGYSQDSCPVNSKYPSIFVGSSSTDCANVKSDVTLKYLSFQTTANSRDAPPLGSARTGTRAALVREPRSPVVTRCVTGPTPWGRGISRPLALLPASSSAGSSHAFKTEVATMVDDTGQISEVLPTIGTCTRSTCVIRGVLV